MPRRVIPQLILASASPRRSELLRNAGFRFSIEAAHVDEAVLPGEDPLGYARRVAREKAQVVHRKFPHDFVLGADTIVLVEGHLLGKPKDASDAARMLSLLAGRAHKVTTAVCLMGPDSDGKCFEDVRSETTEVFMRKMIEEEISDYISSGEPMDKAGAYAIQGRASRWIGKIMGDYFNVVGLPVALVSGMLREHGFSGS